MATRATTVQITMPQMGESVTEGTVLEWLKQVGDRVEQDEPLVEISTDKVDAEVPSPAAGTLVKILAEPDSTVEVGAVLGEIDTDGDAPAADEPDRPTDEPANEAEAAPTDAEPSEAELVDVAFPEMGDSVAEGTVLEWRVKPGDSVAVDDPLVEISTDKVDAELPSPVAGTVQEILVEADETVGVGTILCRIAAGAGAAPEASGNGPVQPAAEPTEPATPAATSGSGNGANATPVAVRTANAHGVDVDSISGTGPRGRVTKDDVLAAVEGNGAPSAPKAAPEPAAGATTPDPRARGHARQVHEREPLDPDGDELPHAPRRRARRPAQGAQGERQEAVLHAPDRLGDRPGGPRHARDGPRATPRRTASPSASRPAASASVSRWTWSARTARAR